MSKDVGTVELQWLKHLWNHEKMFKTRVIRANNHSAKTGGITGISLSFSNMKVCCVFSLQLPHRGIPYPYKKENQLLQLCTAHTALSDSVIRSAKIGWN